MERFNKVSLFIRNLGNDITLHGLTLKVRLLIDSLLKKVNIGRVESNRGKFYVVKRFQRNS